jgi:hypothetical protein
LKPTTPEETVHVTETPNGLAPSEATTLVGAGMFRHPELIALGLLSPKSVMEATQ